MSEKVINDSLLARLDSFHLKTKSIVEGFMVGLHKSPYHGFSVEFADHRQYIPGDPIRNIDWKLYAKTDRYYLKRFEEETNVRSYILLDHSNSMSFKSGTTSKLDYAVSLAAALSYLIVKQKDAIGLISYSDKVTSHLPPKAYSGYLNLLFEQLLSLEPESTTGTLSAMHSVAENLKKRSLIILITDLLDDPNELVKGLQHFKYQKHEVLVFHILDNQEKEFNYKAETEFIDAETGKKITVNPWQIKNRYKEELSSFIEKIRNECFKAGIEYNPINTSIPIEDNLLKYLHKRMLFQ